MEVKAEMAMGSSKCLPQCGELQVSELETGGAARSPHPAAQAMLKLKADGMAPT